MITTEWSARLRLPIMPLAPTPAPIPASARTAHTSHAFPSILAAGVPALPVPRRRSSLRRHPPSRSGAWGSRPRSRGCRADGRGPARPRRDRLFRPARRASRTPSSGRRSTGCARPRAGAPDVHHPEVRERARPAGDRPTPAGFRHRKPRRTASRGFPAPPDLLAPVERQTEEIRGRTPALASPRDPPDDNVEAGRRVGEVENSVLHPRPGWCHGGMARGRESGRVVDAHPSLGLYPPHRSHRHVYEVPYSCGPVQDLEQFGGGLVTGDGTCTRVQQHCPDLRRPSNRS